MCSNIMLFRVSFLIRDLIMCALSVRNEFLSVIAKGAVWVLSGSSMRAYISIACCYESLAGVVVSTVDMGR